MDGGVGGGNEMVDEESGGNGATEPWAVAEEQIGESSILKSWFPELDFGGSLSCSLSAMAREFWIPSSVTVSDTLGLAGSS